ncbi:MAG TPA: hypothetical protein PKK96_00085 [Anaerolineales bacterium]|nr:hypothetical protein [Anaerolineales bacterium]HNQ95167.1 hypothetical protein [Anaerolineales bacterium]HNS59372.1 hypothetical protein [Anaerolineales bacterium]
MNRFQTIVVLTLILFGGAFPALVYISQNGGLGDSAMATLQAVNPAEQLALIVSLFNIKPIYMFLCVAILLTLWDQASASARALFFGLTALLIGELVCGAVFSAFRRELIVSEHIHSFGMALEFSAIAFALIHFLDIRISQTQTRISSLFAFIAAMGILASFLPLAVSPSPSGYHADIFGFPYLYARFEFNQWVESRALPVASIFLFSLALLSTLRAAQSKFTNAAKVFLAAGIGLLAFSILRLSLGALFAERLVWFEFWEETTQLIVISTVTFLLWRFKQEWIQERVALFRGSV